mmetsp:Transcript_15288/g.21493  ORF Transcript_15288/g.21493 Transcript_15288/m.21493 type:complete len:225 (-) Transcript_15288:277-951(-)|eukprot:CAMPEP_0184480982 /NCGR_PEP_ID=MMETSP0113_2-20130426/2525_1 /TAXON_ID=91329 /ORGANISM="Norrisiella sphaerica, Strain BC52" /LENGTH=224 /DNA_ID=CAMNT_0026859833 /DNA_START=200 /DNA_END=874 /DNA_ORIENTATION=+
MDNTLAGHSCTNFDITAFGQNIALMLLWMIQHSGMARPKVKKLLGIYGLPSERGIYGCATVCVWACWVHFWRPVQTCYTWDPLQTPLIRLIPGFFAVIAGIITTLSILYLIPDHIVGTSAEYNNPDREKKVYYRYPYSMLRHPASAGWLYFTWGTALMAASLNHIVWASQWTVFIMFGTYLEEQGLRKEFGDGYDTYSKQVPAFCPYIGYFLEGKRPKELKAAM